LETTNNGPTSRTKINDNFAELYAAASGSAVSHLIIAALGDSHTNGQIPTSAAGSDVVGVSVFGSPKDRSWSGTAYTPLRNNMAINTTTGAGDPNIALSTNVGTFVSWIPPMLRAAYPAIGQITVANLGVGGASTHNWAGEQAHCWIQVVAQANAGDTWTVEGVTYTFVASAAAAYEVTIGASGNATASNLAQAINAEGSGFGAGTVAHPTVYCPLSAAAQYIKVCAKRTGTVGNSLVASCSATTRIASSRFDLVPMSTVTFGQGSNTGALYANAKARLIGLPIGQPGVKLIFTLTTGSNDAVRRGYRGQFTQEALQKLVADISTDYPGSKLVVWRTPTVSGASAGLTAVLAAVDAVIAANPAIVVGVDMNALGNGTGNTKILASDGIHLTHYGYSLAAGLFADGIAAAALA
jgi:hypothetical protein